MKHRGHGNFALASRAHTWQESRVASKEITPLLQEVGQTASVHSELFSELGSQPLIALFLPTDLGQRVLEEGPQMRPIFKQLLGQETSNSSPPGLAW